MGPSAHGCADVAREGADVRSLGASHFEMHVLPAIGPRGRLASAALHDGTSPRKAQRRDCHRRLGPGQFEPNQGSKNITVVIFVSEI